MTTGFIFLALAVAWALYLIPKALSHHEEAERVKVAEKLSTTSRVVARREAVDARSSILISGSGLDADSVARLAAARRAATVKATKRRRNVLVVLIAALAVVAGVAGFDVITWLWVAAPVGLVIAWLVTCRLTVRAERRVWASAASPQLAADEADSVGFEGDDNNTTTTPSAVAEDADVESVEAQDAIAEGLWAPVPMTLPTYVDAPVARRTVRPIDLDATGVWTSGRTREASEIAAEAEAFRAAAREAEAEAEQNRAVGS
jgi:hypothetical protein